MERTDPRLRREPRRLVEPPEERDAIEEEAELRGDQRRAEEDDHRGEADPYTVAAPAPGYRWDADDEDESNGEREAQRRHRVQRPGVEVVLVDREVDDGGENDRNDSRDPQRSAQLRPGEADERDGNQREGKVERNELPPESCGNRVAVMNVVELARREARVRRDHRDAVEHDQREGRPDLPGDSLHASPKGGQVPAR